MINLTSSLLKRVDLSVDISSPSILANMLETDLVGSDKQAPFSDLTLTIGR